MLCESHGWIATDFDSVRSATREFHRAVPRVVLVRHKLSDGYADEVILQLRTLTGGETPKIIVLIDAAVSHAAEARQITLGADYVQRDPVRTEILTAYLSKFLLIPQVSRTIRKAQTPRSICVAGAELSLSDRVLQRRGKATRLTPKEAELTESLFHARGAVIRYESLYDEVFRRKFTGDTSNMRVLLGKLAASFGRIGLNLRRWIEVVPKAGYRLHNAPPGKPGRKSKGRRK
jgi:hypothetical protein